MSFGLTYGKYSKDLHFLPTILYHNGDGMYHTLELVWFKWFVGIVWDDGD